MNIKNESLEYYEKNPTFDRTDLLNFLIYKYNYKNYLEIGVFYGDNFEKIECQNKVGVDPGNNYKFISHNMTSDEFFNQNQNSYDLIFIDGLHVKEQVIKDIENGLKVLNPQGTIVLHDCLPYSEESQSPIPYFVPIWLGNVWEAFAHYRQYPDLFMMTISTDFGLGLIKRGNQIPYSLPETLNYKYFLQNTQELMNVVNCGNGLKVIDKLYKNGL